MASEMEFTEEERNALLQLKVSIQDVIEKRHNFDNDTHLIRWLRARKLNVSKAENMIRQSIIFRDEHSLDHMDKWRMPEVLEKYLPYGMFGEDIHGHPIIYLRIGRTDLKGLAQCASKAELIRTMEYKSQIAVERCQMQSEKYGRRINQCVFVVDLEGLSMQTHLSSRTLSYMKALIRSSEDNYPELTAMAIILTNSPLFHLCWELLSHFIDEGTKNKIHFVRPSEFEEKLCRLIPKDQLPACYGGNALFPDRNCTDAVNMGGIVPEKYYLKNWIDKSELELTLVTVPPRTISLVPVVVREAGSVLHWIFKTESYDISFSVHYQPLTETETETGPPTERKCVLANQRYDSHLVPEQSYLVCQLSGTYFLHFDNSYSWVHSKQVRYFYNVVQPNS